MDVAPSPTEYLPGPHKSQEDAPAFAEYLPAGHFIHTDSDVPFGLEEYLPAAHSVHDVAPAAAHEPAAHPVQVEAPAAEYVPATQFKHDADEVAPVVGLYLPAAHDRQEVPSLYLPAAQPAHDVAPPPGENWPPGHIVHPVLVL
jgi:hypothetical protein